MVKPDRRPGARNGNKAASLVSVLGLNFRKVGVAELLLRPPTPPRRAFLEEHAEKPSTPVGFNHLHEIPQLCGDQGSPGMMALA